MIKGTSSKTIHSLIQSSAVCQVNIQLAIYLYEFAGWIPVHYKAPMHVYAHVCVCSAGRGRRSTFQTLVKTRLNRQENLIAFENAAHIMQSIT